MSLKWIQTPVKEFNTISLIGNFPAKSAMFFFSELIVLILALKDNFCLILLLMGIIAASTTVYSELKSEFKFFNAIKWQRLNNSFG